MQPIDPVDTKITQFMDSSSYFSPSAAEIQVLFDKRVGSLPLDQVEDLRERVSDLKAHIEEKERGSFKWEISKKLYKLCYKTASCFWNFFAFMAYGRLPSFTSSYAIAEKMERELIIKSSLANFPESTKAPKELNCHPFACQGVMLTEDYVVVSGFGKDAKGEVELKLKDTPYKAFTKKEEDIEKVHGIPLSRRVAADIARQYYRIEGQQFYLGETDKVIQKLIDIGIHKEMIPKLSSLVDQGFTSDVLGYIYTTSTEGVALKGRELRYFITKERGRLVVQARINMVAMKDGILLGSMPFGMRVSLPLDKIMNGKEISKNDLKVSHSYGAFRKE